jgi:hypothetical protein
LYNFQSEFGGLPVFNGQNVQKSPEKRENPSKGRFRTVQKKFFVCIFDYQATFWHQVMMLNSVLGQGISNIFEDNVANFIENKALT